ncbi:MAG TPA: multicopper oxidase domain-containing protein, partial [Gemmatimonadales bacterium]|nr:multicopper oxidase domain-containing protein [Gemmatimonadales bacterium]
MTRMMGFTLATGLLMLSGCATAPAFDPGTIKPNDNRQAAGSLTNGRLTLALETRTGKWFPEGPNGHGLDSLAAFAVVGGPLTTPGPLVRVPAGTVVGGTLHNTLNRALTVFGLGKTRGLSDSLIVAPGATANFEFTAGTPGTFYYYGRSGLDPIGARPGPDTQLHGAIVVDGATPLPDRVMAISWYFTINPKSPSGLGTATMAINGQSWPHTERLQYAQGDSIRWRVINFTEADHPMHLHGFYFRLDSKGNGVTDSLYSAAQQRMAVTEVIQPFQTMALAWQADRPGNWIFHCHYAAHLSGLVSLDTENGAMDSTMLMHHASDRPHQMF